MFDWALAFDMSFGAFHLAGEGDMGWFSRQTMRKINQDSFPAPVSIAYVASGRATTGMLYAGYRLGQKSYLMPLAGWIYDSVRLNGSQPIPPFQRLAASAPYLFADASIEILSRETQVWQGPLLGAQLSWQPLGLIRFTGLYAYSWLRASHSFSEIDTLRTYLPGPTLSTVQEISQNANTRRSGHGNVGVFQTLFFLSQKISLDFNFRYLSLQDPISQLNSFTLWSTLDYRF